MGTSDIVLAYAIILIFAAVFFYSFIVAGKSHIADNWDMYKCSPMVSPFSSYICNIGSPCQYTDPSNVIMARPTGIVFADCIKNSQSGQMKTLLEPVWSIVGSVGNATSSMNSNMSLLGSFFNTFQQMFGSIVSSLTSSIKNVIGGVKGASGHFTAGLNQGTSTFGVAGSMGDSASGGIKSGWDAYPGAFIKAASNPFG